MPIDRDFLPRAACRRPALLKRTVPGLWVALAGTTVTLLLGAAAYGWWHAATHATFEVQLIYKSEGASANRLRSGQLEFVDRDGRVLARATIDTRRSVVWLAHPEKGQCGPALDRAAHRECFRAQSTWIPTWADRVHQANVTLERCSIAAVPVNLYTRRDNIALWWLPLAANRRGQPYTRYSATLTVHQRVCG